MLEVIWSYLPYVIVTTFTPGPNNIMTLYAVSTLGWRKGSRVILGIVCGFLVVMLTTILFCHELAQYAPGVIEYLKYFGAAYILWLAVHIALSTPANTNEHSINFKSGFLLALSNMKVILYLITLFTAFVIPSGANFFEMLLHGAFVISLSAVSWGLWGTAGGLLQKFLVRYYRPFNILMGLILALCAVKILM
ncbi:MAG: LysE family transporter [Synergistaceae bacterium]|nr:LysE family transporter [Synergistaceae bacterium]